VLDVDGQPQASWVTPALLYMHEHIREYQYVVLGSLLRMIRVWYVVRCQYVVAIREPVPAVSSSSSSSSSSPAGLTTFDL
jgi:hypothetical protein